MPFLQRETSRRCPHKPLAFDQILVHLFLLFVFNLVNKILFKPKGNNFLGVLFALVSCLLPWKAKPFHKGSSLKGKNLEEQILSLKS